MVVVVILLSPSHTQNVTQQHQMNCSEAKLSAYIANTVPHRDLSKISENFVDSIEHVEAAATLGRL